MDKYTDKSGNKFGGQWTQEKLIIIEKYIYFYTKALSKQGFELLYIDAFAGNGAIQLKSGDQKIDGSAVISLKYDFDKYYFIEADPNRKKLLEAVIKERFPKKFQRVSIINDNCNNCLGKILSSLRDNQRAVMFLDPFALELEWQTLIYASKKKILDIWYLFSLSTLNRMLPKNTNKSHIDEITKKVNIVLGTSEWKSVFYNKSPQISFLENESYQRVNYDEVVKFITDRLKKIFVYVSPKSKILTNSKSSPLFILYFMMTNDGPKAIDLGSKVVNQIFNKVNEMTKGK